MDTNSRYYWAQSLDMWETNISKYSNLYYPLPKMCRGQWYRMVSDYGYKTCGASIEGKYVTWVCVAATEDHKVGESGGLGYKHAWSICGDPKSLHPNYIPLCLNCAREANLQW